MTETTHGEDFFHSGNEERGLRIDTYGTGISVTTWDKTAKEYCSVLLQGDDGRKLSAWLANFYSKNPQRLEP